MSAKTKFRPVLSPNRYVNSGVGLRVFFFVAGFACVAGLGLRLYFHPERVKTMVEQALGADAQRIGLKFHSARLSLAHGSIPQIAVEVRDVEINPAHECRTEPSVRIARLFLPLDLTRLLRLQVSLGTIASEDIQVDLDALKAKCTDKPQASKPSDGVAARVGSPDPWTGDEPAVKVEKFAPVLNTWWTTEQAESVRRKLEGVEFSRATLLFEGATKKVYLESFSAEPGSLPGSVRFESILVIPPELTFGEQLPKLKIEAIANPAAAEVKVHAALSEGTLIVTGRLLAAPGGFLDADLHAAVDEVPVSTLVPLIKKSGIIKGAFQPRFMWMNCQASIRGRFQGLFVENPLNLSDCEIEGKGAKIQIGEAIRQPDGTWQPFVVKMSNVDLGQILDAFDSRLLDGVLSDYGRFDGEMRVQKRHVAELSGYLSGAQIRFLNSSERAEQLVPQMHVRVEARDGNISGYLDHIKLDKGDFLGQLMFSVADGGKQSSLRAVISNLKFSDDVQKVLFGGTLDTIKGNFEAKFVGNKLSAGRGKIRLEKLNNKDLRFREVQLQIETRLAEDQRREIYLEVSVPPFEIRRESRYFLGLRPIFFTHEFAGDWIAIDEMQVRGTMQEQMAEGFQWANAQVSLEGRKIRLTSAGSMNAQHEIQGWLSVDFPRVRGLKWRVGGQVERLELHPDSDKLLELQKKGVIDDTRLGLSASGLLGKKSSHE